MQIIPANYGKQMMTDKTEKMKTVKIRAKVQSCEHIDECGMQRLMQNRM